MFVFHFHRDTIVGKSDSLPKIDGGRITDQDIGSDSFAALPWIIFEPLDYAAANTKSSCGSFIVACPVNLFKKLWAEVALCPEAPKLMPAKLGVRKS